MAGTKARLLIVDDEPTTRETFSCIFAELGYQVRTAPDGIAALVAFRESVPDILISDLNMPVMSGFELLSVVRQRFPELRTIAMSGAFCGDEVPSGVAADAFYQKGSSVASLLKLMESVEARERAAWQHAKLPGSAIGAKDGAMHICPECLRPYTVPEEPAAAVANTVICSHCKGLIQVC